MLARYLHAGAEDIYRYRYLESLNNLNGRTRQKEINPVKKERLWLLPCPPGTRAINQAAAAAAGDMRTSFSTLNSDHSNKMDATRTSGQMGSVCMLCTS